MEKYLAVPYYVLGIEEINLTSKVLLAEIISLSKNSGVCFASNEFLSERIGVTERCIAKQMNELREKEYIICERKGRKRYINLNTEKLNNEKCSVNIMDENCLGKYEHYSEKDEHCSEMSAKSAQYKYNYNNKYNNNYNSDFKKYGYDKKRNYDINELMKIQ